MFLTQRFPALVLTMLITGGCVSKVRDIDPGPRWSVAPSAVEDNDIRRILLRLPSTVACIHDDRPERCGIPPIDYVVDDSESRRRQLFSDGELHVYFPYSDDTVRVLFSGRSPRSIGFIELRRKGRSFVPVRVGVIAVD